MSNWEEGLIFPYPMILTIVPLYSTFVLAPLGTLQTTMRELKAGKASQKQHPQRLEAGETSLSLPIRSSLEILQQRNGEGMRRLETQAGLVNELSAELEAAMLELKAIASEMNRDWRAIQLTIGSVNRPTAAIPNVCEYQVTNVPNVQRKRSGAFILTSRPVDLFKAEREATLLAQALRRRSRKRSNSDR